ncbi:MAG: type II toxin-antitoxin system VapC family toxin [Acidimicrobiia bacterium]|nr:type II toxin-antitoxin system VapC family toxin [Acidimicrobiia bacterium]
MGKADLSILQQSRRVFADTAFFFELLDPGAPHHTRAREIAAALESHAPEVTTSWEIVVECATLLRYRLHDQAAKIFLAEIVPELTLLYPDDEERLLAMAEFLKRGKERRLSLCDALSYVLITRRLGRKAPCLSFDDDFSALGLLVIR